MPPRIEDRGKLNPQIATDPETWMRQYVEGQTGSPLIASDLDAIRSVSTGKAAPFQVQGTTTPMVRRAMSEWWMKQQSGMAPRSSMPMADASNQYSGVFTPEGEPVGSPYQQAQEKQRLANRGAYEARQAEQKGSRLRRVFPDAFGGDATQQTQRATAPPGYMPTAGNTTRDAEQFAREHTQAQNRNRVVNSASIKAAVESGRTITDVGALQDAIAEDPTMFRAMVKVYSSSKDSQKPTMLEKEQMDEILYRYRILNDKRISSQGELSASEYDDWNRYRDIMSSDDPYAAMRVGQTKAPAVSGNAIPKSEADGLLSKIEEEANAIAARKAAQGGKLSPADVRRAHELQSEYDRIKSRSE